MRTVPDIDTSVFNVNIVAPPEKYKPVPKKKVPSAAKEKEPIIIPKKRRPPSKEQFSFSRPRPDDKSSPETMLGKGSSHAGKSAEDSKGKKELSTPKIITPETNEAVPSTGEKRDHTPLLPGKDDMSLVPGVSLFDRKTIEKYARKGSPAQRGLSFDTSGFNHRGYMRMLRERIGSVWHYPKEAAKRGISGDLRVTFTINKDGSLANAELLRTSGYRSLDEAVLKALRKAFPWWPLPKDYEEDTVEIKGHFIYVYGDTYAL